MGRVVLDVNILIQDSLECSIISYENGFNTGNWGEVYKGGD